MSHYDVVVVGAGHAGTQLVFALTAGGFTGSIALIGDEVATPYERPPLTKGYLADETLSEDLAFRSESWWAGSNVERHLGTRVVAVDAEAHTVTTEDGGAIGYGTLVWSAGGEARRLPVPGADLDGVHVVRKLSDAERVKQRLGTIKNAVVIGGGYIGLETAASLRKLGVNVTVVEALERLLQRVTGEDVAAYIKARHEREGVDILLGTGVSELIGDAGHVTGVRLSSGRELPADLVVVGIGLVPNVSQLADAGAEVGNGVLVDKLCRTSLPDVYAIGDCASFESDWVPGDRLRLESVQNANDQAKTVANAILGDPKPYDALPWFWSHQYDDRLQTAGVLTGYDAPVLRGDPASGKFSVVYLRGNTVAAVDAINNVKDYAQAKALIGRTVLPGDPRLADPSVPLKSFVAEAQPA
ncbi:NAD(P)/FAD-dependent oxidoreductase [Agromyces sp. Marseille-P2726]|uniref:NAD(P)/FAD-dependent oxidoreductase n=1 Tax=Agromyces sp. Marseille-P2726 TaxID=2709132 RepID=UPI00156F73F9|nr:FAD-dependent oxidoreductase [Agromyces sp. Marseille-P2726]